MAVLVFLAAAARTRIVASHALATVADRFGFVVTLAAGAGLFHRFFQGIGRAANRIVAGARFLERAADKILVQLFYLEDQFCDAVVERLPHLLEHLHAFALVLDLWIDLGITHQANRAA